ncbi:trypsin-like peptidase domain-containing protein [Gemmata sp.]|uniref:trypsin-like peptidase domain-containing protein n=1 Tax=Gemmata sp. TaxID=1914242 RepID=UPI003F7160B7
MMRSPSAVVLALLGVFMPSPAVAQQDVRVLFGTDHLGAARAVQRGDQATAAGKHKEAAAAFKDAVRLDPLCGAALFRMALALGDAGDIDEALATYKKVLAADVNATRLTRAVAATNLGLTYGQLGKLDESNLWFTRAIMEDSDNQLRERGKAYRNLAINLRTQKRPLASAVAVAMAYEDKARNCDIAMVREFFRGIGGVETARVLYTEADSPPGKPRADRPELEAVKLDAKLAGVPADLLADPRGRYVIGTAPGLKHFHLIGTGEAVAARQVETDPYLGACLVGGSLYLSRQGPDRVDQVDVETGKTLKSFELGKPAPATFAVAHGRVFFPSGGIVHQYDTRTGEVRETNTPGTVVRGHPGQQFVFSYTKAERGGGRGFVVVDGRVFLVDRGLDWVQTTLFKSVVTPGGLLLAEARDNAASNGTRLTLSPDGRWVGVVGGGGFRPSDKAAGGGYGVALFDARNTEKLQGVFPSGAYPVGCAVNPVTGTVVAIREGAFTAYPLGNAAAGKEYPGKWGGAATWSGDGRTLVVAKSPEGVSVFRVALTKDEEAVAAKWPDALEPAPLVGLDKPRPAAEPLASLEAFAVPAEVTPELVRKRLDRSIEHGRVVRPAHWAAHPSYAKERAAVGEAAGAIQALRTGTAEKLGVALYKLKQADKATPNFPPLLFFKAEVQSLRDLKEEAEQGFQSAARLDAGQTDVTLLALEGLARFYAAGGSDLKAAYCWAAALEVDRVDPKTVRKLLEALKKAKLDAEAERVSKLETAGGPDAATPAAVRGLPPLPAPPADPAKLAGEDLYALAAPSVVVVKSGDGSGSGVCVGRADVVVTNAHVVDRADEVEVQVFAVRDKKLVRAGVAKGKVIYRAEGVDLAVIQLPATAPKLTPLPVATASPKAGARVYALGSPGLGSDVLEQSISDGLVSAAARKLDGRTYLQHTSAVNPGNSGGPLVDEYGRVVGIVTLKAKLDNVSFAVPVETLRGLFPEAPAPK